MRHAWFNCGVAAGATKRPTATKAAGRGTRRRPITGARKIDARLDPSSVGKIVGMCGRYTRYASWSELVHYWRILDHWPAAEPLRPQYNVAPTREVAVIRADAEGERSLSMLHWGFTPSWSKDGKLHPVNVMSETAPTKPMFRSAFKKRRCLLAADGFYEWRKVGKAKHPVYYTIKGGKQFGFAGLWETWQGEDTTALLTTTPNELVKEVHNRMPVILQPKYYDERLDSANDDVEQLASMLTPYPADEMEATPVSDFVNNVRNQGPQCIEAVKE
jgi:putative SOS response-associated peptidase YedK